MPLAQREPGQQWLQSPPATKQHVPPMQVEPLAHEPSHGQHGPPGCAHVQTPV